MRNSSNYSTANAIKFNNTGNFKSGKLAFTDNPALLISAI